MPVIKSAGKKLRADRTKEKRNNILRDLLKKSLKSAKKSPSPSNLSKAFKVLDKMSKQGLIHKNKSARIKSSLSKLTKPKKSAPSK